MRDRYFRGSLATLCYRGIFAYLAVFPNLVLFLCWNWVEGILLSFLLWALGDRLFHTWGWLFPTCFGWSVSMLNSWDLLVISVMWTLLSGLLWSSDLPICTLMRRIWSPTLTLCLVIKALSQPMVALGSLTHHKGQLLTSSTSSPAFIIFVIVIITIISFFLLYSLSYGIRSLV